MRILFNTLFRLIQTDQFQHFDCTFMSLFLRTIRMKQDRFFNLISDRVSRIQRRHRVLEDDTDLRTADLPHLFIADRGNILAAVQNLSALDLAGAGQDPHDRISRHAFAGTGFTDNTQYFAFIQIEGKPVHRFHFPRIRKK